MHKNATCNSENEATALKSNDTRDRLARIRAINEQSAATQSADKSQATRPVRKFADHKFRAITGSTRGSRKPAPGTISRTTSLLQRFWRREVSMRRTR